MEMQEKRDRYGHGKHEEHEDGHRHRGGDEGHRHHEGNGGEGGHRHHEDRGGEGRRRHHEGRGGEGGHRHHESRGGEEGHRDHEGRGGEGGHRHHESRRGEEGHRDHEGRGGEGGHRDHEGRRGEEGHRRHEGRDGQHGGRPERKGYRSLVEKPGTHLLFIGSRSCTRHKGTVKLDLQREGKLTFLSLEEIDWITGGYLGQIEEAAREIAKEQHPQHLVLFGGCQIELLSTDYETMTQNLSQELGIEVRFHKGCHLVGYDPDATE